MAPIVIDLRIVISFMYSFFLNRPWHCRRASMNIILNLFSINVLILNCHHPLQISFQILRLHVVGLKVKLVKLVLRRSVGHFRHSGMKIIDDDNISKTVAKTIKHFCLKLMSLYHSNYFLSNIDDILFEFQRRIRVLLNIRI